MQLHIDARLEPPLYVIRYPFDLPGKPGLSRQLAREEAKASMSRPSDSTYFRARAEAHERSAAQTKHPAARAAHLDFADRYRQRSLEAGDDNLTDWINEGGSWR